MDIDHRAGLHRLAHGLWHAAREFLAASTTMDRLFHHSRLACPQSPLDLKISIAAGHVALRRPMFLSGFCEPPAPHVPYHIAVCSTLTCKITSLTLIPIPAMVKKEPEPEAF